VAVRIIVMMANTSAVTLKMSIASFAMFNLYRYLSISSSLFSLFSSSYSFLFSRYFFIPVSFSNFILFIPPFYCVLNSLFKLFLLSSGVNCA